MPKGLNYDLLARNLKTEAKKFYKQDKKLYTCMVLNNKEVQIQLKCKQGDMFDLIHILLLNINIVFIYL